jgi:NADPH:quinone reductase-like Zn-dependent oxidoreductase
MRAIVAEEFGGYQNLKLADIPKPAVSVGRALVRMSAAGVTPLDHTFSLEAFQRQKRLSCWATKGPASSRGVEMTSFRMDPE